MNSLRIYLNRQRRLRNFKAYLSEESLKGQNAFINIYSEEEIRKDKSKKKATLTPFLIGKNKPSVIICPGGAYEFISYCNEGAEFAKAFNERGFNAFVLAYRTDKNASYPAPFEDLARAVYYIKENSKSFDTDAGNFFICGSSAGGHLCSLFAANYKDFETDNRSLKPNAVVLTYPVVSMMTETHSLSRQLLIGKDLSDENKRNKSAELIATESYPPAFIWHCEDDDCVPVSNSKRLGNRLSEVGVNCKLCIYPSGGHGIGLAKGTSAEGWFDEAVNFINQFTKK